MVTEYSRAPTEPNSAQPGSAAEDSALGREEQAELERLRAETAELRRVAAVALAALILVFWGQPTGLVVIVLVVILLVLLGLIELIGRPPAPAAPA